MDPFLSRAILRGDVLAIRDLLGKNPTALDTPTEESNDTALHVACIHGHVEAVEILLRWRPEMTAARNANGETAMHKACSHGHVEVVKRLMEINQWLACDVDNKDRSPLLLACFHGQIAVVKHLLMYRWILLGCDGEDGRFTPLHAAVSFGRADIVEELLIAKPSLSRKVDKNGETTLHYACQRKDVDITKMLLCFDPQLAMETDKMGLTPLHVAAINATVEMMNEFVLRAPLAFHYLTTDDETVFHLFAKFDHFEALKFLMQVFSGDSTIINHANRCGNTPLHIAALRKSYKFAEYFIKISMVEVDARNDKNETAFNILENYWAAGDHDEHMCHLMNEMENICSQRGGGDKTAVDETAADMVDIPQTPYMDDNMGFVVLDESSKSSTPNPTPLQDHGNPSAHIILPMF